MDIQKKIRLNYSSNTFICTFRNADIFHFTPPAEVSELSNSKAQKIVLAAAKMKRSIYKTKSFDLVDGFGSKLERVIL